MLTYVCTYVRTCHVLVSTWQTTWLKCDHRLHVFFIGTDTRTKYVYPCHIEIIPLFPNSFQVDMWCKQVSRDRQHSHIQSTPNGVNGPVKTCFATPFSFGEIYVFPGLRSECVWFHAWSCFVLVKLGLTHSSGTPSWSACWFKHHMDAARDARGKWGIWSWACGSVGMVSRSQISSHFWDGLSCVLKTGSHAGWCPPVMFVGL
jgi:hypothetical protein